MSRNLAELDATILRELGKDPQFPKEELAKALDVTVPWLTGRINSLHARNAIQIRPVLNVEKANRVFVFCKLAINSANIEATLKKLAEHPTFVTVASMTGGKYNAFVYFTFGDMAELNRIVRDILTTTDGVAEMETLIISGTLFSESEYLNYTGLTYRPTVEESVQILTVEAAQCGLDELDIRIIAELQSNQRKSLRAIARDYDISPGTVRYRLQRLETEGIIRYISFVDAKEVALGCFMIVELRIEADALPIIVSRLKDAPWLGHLHEVVGASDLIAFVSAPNLREGQAVVSNHIRSLPGIRSVSVRLLLDTFKLDPRWGFIARDT